MEPQYGESEHYKGAAGDLYFQWQSKNGDINGKLNAHKFRNYVRPQDCVLDFGSGGGDTLANLVCRRRIAIDANPIALQAAKVRGLECYAALEMVSDSTVDVLISNHALEHVPRPIDALSEMRQKLKPNGTLVLVVPIDDWRTQRSFDPADINHHLYTWTPLLLGNILFEAGFDVSKTDVRILTHGWFPGYSKIFSHVPWFLFNSLCILFAILARRRQLIAVVNVG